MDILYAPWRNKYVNDIRRTNNGSSEDECVFCHQLKEDKDEHHFVLRRFKHCYVMLNLHPYNAGHLLVLPYAHVAHLNALSQEARIELIELLSHGSAILKEVLSADGVNIGANIEKAAGAGIPHHLHFHVLPRWNGDTNFMPTLMQTKQISVDLHDIYKKLKPAFASLSM